MTIPATALPEFLQDIQTIDCFEKGGLAPHVISRERAQELAAACLIYGIGSKRRLRKVVLEVPVDQVESALHQHRIGVGVKEAHRSRERGPNAADTRTNLNGGSREVYKEFLTTVCAITGQHERSGLWVYRLKQSAF